MRDELLDLTGALKDLILSEKESRSGISSLYLKGDVAMSSSIPVDTMPNSGTIRVSSVTLEDIRGELGDCTRCKL
ncbi:MAG: hypothetical protein E4H15_08940, partial [Syntrophobacterales bacterium]